MDAPLLRGPPEYAKTGLQTLRANWPDVDTYVVDGLGVEPSLLEALRARLVAP